MKYKGSYLPLEYLKYAVNRVWKKRRGTGIYLNCQPSFHNSAKGFYPGILHPPNPLSKAWGFPPTRRSPLPW